MLDMSGINSTGPLSAGGPAHSIHKAISTAWVGPQGPYSHPTEAIVACIHAPASCAVWARYGHGHHNCPSSPARHSPIKPDPLAAPRRAMQHGGNKWVCSLLQRMYGMHHSSLLSFSFIVILQLSLHAYLLSVSSLG